MRVLDGPLGSGHMVQDHTGCDASCTVGLPKQRHTYLWREQHFSNIRESLNKGLANKGMSRNMSHKVAKEKHSSINAAIVRFETAFLFQL